MRKICTLSNGESPARAGPSPAIGGIAVTEYRTNIDYLNYLQNPALDPMYNARQSRYVLARNF